MILLVLGVSLFAAAHLLSTLGTGLRGKVIARVGKDPYRGLFSLVILASISMMVFGWQSATPGFVYAPPAWASWVANALMLVALLLIVASALPTNAKRFLRHPQLCSVLTWAVAHGFANGDSSSLVLFGGLGAWSVAAMFALNRRDGAWQKPEPLPIGADLKPIVGGLFLFALLYWAHPWFTGVSPMPR